MTEATTRRGGTGGMTSSVAHWHVPDIGAKLADR